MEQLKLTIKDGTPNFEYLTRDQIEEILANFRVNLPVGFKVVVFAQTSPQDTCYYWQPIDGFGDPVGKIKKFDEDTQEWV